MTAKQAASRSPRALLAQQVLQVFWSPHASQIYHCNQSATNICLVTRITRQFDYSLGQNVTLQNPAPPPSGHPLLSGPPTLTIHQIADVSVPRLAARLAGFSLIKLITRYSHLPRHCNQSLQLVIASRLRGADELVKKLTTATAKQRSALKLDASQKRRQFEEKSRQMKLLMLANGKYTRYMYINDPLTANRGQTRTHTLHYTRQRRD